MPGSSSLVRALERLEQTIASPLTDVPPAWIKATALATLRPDLERKDEWEDADSIVQRAQVAVKLFPLFPVEAWCQSAVYKPMFEIALKQLVAWTAERLMPSWRRERAAGSHQIIALLELIEWNGVLGDLLARAAPFFDTEFVRKEFLAPFLTDDKEGLAVLAQFADDDGYAAGSRCPHDPGERF